ncbi:MAG: SRPBCC family protein, partial [Alphaproteobacteria bacterium]
RLFLIILILVIMLIAGAFFLPGERSVARWIEIEAPPETVFPYVNDFRQFNRWSPWASRDPDTVYEFEGPSTGAGSIMKWDSAHPQVGTGRQEITATEPNSRVDTIIAFDGMGDATASFVLEPLGDTTKVSWHFNTQLGMNPMWRYMGVMMDRWVGGDYEDGLANLKILVEAEK